MLWEYALKLVCVWLLALMVAVAAEPVLVGSLGVWALLGLGLVPLVLAFERRRS